MSDTLIGRRKPYTRIGLKRLSCARCGDPASRQVVFPIDDLWKPMCVKCEEELNLIYLIFMEDPDIDEKIAQYHEETE
jgi:hypothetical protein